MRELGPVPYSEKQREQFRNHKLRDRWVGRYPEIFDSLDACIAANQPKYHFFEWLGAIVLFETLGYLSLVEQYEFRNHPQKQEKLGRLLRGRQEVFNFIVHRDRSKDATQCPDLLVYAPDFSHYFFCECKAYRERVSPKQEEIFKRLSEVSAKETVILRFKPEALK
ncbi:MAG: hypothetical protein HYX92_01375 [Chloroflexi bacterium]|nr:hypothetical protein [Chloroflexota bacterium]